MTVALISLEIQKAIDQEVAKFPSGRERSALIFGLKEVQKANGGHLTTELMDAVADYLNQPRILAYEVATFYAMLKTTPQGRYRVNVCNNISCLLKGCNKIIRHLEKTLGIPVGETTQDGLFTLKEIECLAHCEVGPMLQVNDEKCYGNLTPDSVDALIARLRQEAKSDA